MKRVLVAVASLMLIGWSLHGAQAQVEQLAAYRGPGGIDGAVIGPGPAAGSQRLYLAYMYVNRTVDLVSVDPTSGKWKVFENPAKPEFGAIMILGPDGDIYLGTRPHAHIYQLSPRTGRYRDLGQPAPGEAYIWELTVASDGKIYGCTYPSAKLVRYDPASGKLEDLGRMDPKEEYGRTIAASDDGFVYMGIGTAHAHLVAYQISTGQHRGILPASVDQAIDKNGEGSTAEVHKGRDGKIYAVVGGHYFLVKDWVAHEIPETDVQAAKSTTLLKDGRQVTVDGNELLIHDPRSAKVDHVPYTYPGREGVVFRFAAGPDGRIYGSSILPFHLFALDVNRKKLKDFGHLGGGEAYSLVPFDGKLYIAAYGAAAPLMAFDPAQRFGPGTEPGSNPQLITYDGADHGWRPQAMIVGPGRKFYIGSVAGYGSVNGPLTIFDPRTNQVVKFSGVVPDESIVSLAATRDLIVGGTSIFGGGGSHPTRREAKLFLWDPLHNRKTYETIPVPGATNITDLLALPGGKVMGIATGMKPDITNPTVTPAGPQSTLFVFDLRSRKCIYTVPVTLGGITYNSVALGPNGGVWGLAQDGIFRFDPKTRHMQLKVKTPAPVTAGFALLNGNIYYASGPVIYRYVLPTG
jgi:outer membrane protein assembly factor BamB